MEGLALSRTLAELREHLPARTLGWVFPDETSAALLFEGQKGVSNLVLSYRPPQPVIYLSRERLRGDAHNAFQRFLAAKVRGELFSAEQLKLDRVAQFAFAGEGGFVDVSAVRLLFELTGRNTNLLVLEPLQEDADAWQGRILSAGREITNSRNRFRTVRSGGAYVPPPPYDKFDPRTMTAQEAESLADLPVSRWREQIDGLGPSLSAELVRRTGFVGVAGERWPQVLEALKSLVVDPTLSASEASLNDASREAARAEKAAQLRKALREPLAKRLTLLTHQLGDVERATLGLDEAAQDRREADLLMAYAHTVEAGASSALLPDFSGEGEVPIALEPSLSAIQNAEKRYTRARRREDVFERLAEREPTLREDYAEVERRLSDLDASSLEQLAALETQLTAEQPLRSAYGARYTSPGGFEVLVGRNNKENATLTHRLGRSTDYWFHVQGYPGSHVLVRTGGRDLDLPDILYAAQLAAQHSKARLSGNVPVDYTRIKHVWRPKGAPSGQVHYTQQKTVYVDPPDARSA
ncbi:fibronectin-binding domain-containing protein [Deinococcus psychrotolerans]|uniref:Fibronectin-binding domain-containing protein n=1 Tax=Deinococcus psychrotolerans TaxID=2489213 RepID=A0A3G8YDF6_9DEIO|nr:NFACT family protein [Deinococcus psychrotolerans]AZI43352.1 fibronectin-binding domain-containing protein [Deinococcus psychrotolerans]